MNSTDTYKKVGHDLIKHDQNCQKCPLGVTRAWLNKQLDPLDTRKTQLSVGGAGPIDLTKVKLILISDYPGHYEALNGYPQFDACAGKEERRDGILIPHNSGAFIRMTLNAMYGLNTYDDMWITNAVKCNPMKTKVVESRHLKPCIAAWLRSEFLILDEHCPNVPILVAGLHAFRAVKVLYKTDASLLESLGFNGCRRRGDIKLGTHPAVFCPNPARAARSEARIETQVMYKEGYFYPSRNQWLPPIVGGPVWSILQDLRFLKPFITNDNVSS